jgi:hypothetical protein
VVVNKLLLLVHVKTLVGDAPCSMDGRITSVVIWAEQTSPSNKAVDFVIYTGIVTASPGGSLYDLSSSS